MHNWGKYNSARLWSQSIARGSLMGHERTNNPTPAAAAMLGKKRVAKAVRVMKRKGKKRAHKGNPLPAVAALLASGLGKKLLGKLGIGGSPRYEGGPLVTTVQDFLNRIQRGDLAAVAKLHDLATSPAEPARQAWAKVWNVEVPALGGSLPLKVRAEIKRLDPTSTLGAGSGEKAGGLTQLANIANTPVGQRVATELVRAAVRRPRSRRRGYGYGGYAPRRRRSYSDEYDEGEGAPPGISQASFPGSSVASKAGKAALVVGAGVAAYLATQAALRHFGGRAVAKEQAGVEAALAFREARQDFAAQQGRPPTAAEVRQMGVAFKAKLAELGYSPTGVRTRSATERFLSDYSREE